MITCVDFGITIRLIIGTLALLSCTCAQGEGPGLRNPFTPLTSTPLPTPPPNSQDLRDYPPNTLRLTAIFTNLSGERMASLETPHGIGFPVRVGSEIGPKRATVVRISSDSVAIQQGSEESASKIELFIRPQQRNGS